MANERKRRTDPLRISRGRSGTHPGRKKRSLHRLNPRKHGKSREGKGGPRKESSRERAQQKAPTAEKRKQHFLSLPSARPIGASTCANSPEKRKETLVKSRKTGPSTESGACVAGKARGRQKKGVRKRGVLGKGGSRQGKKLRGGGERKGVTQTTARNSPSESQDRLTRAKAREGGSQVSELASKKGILHRLQPK